VWQSITLSLLTVILTWSVSRWRPGFRFDPSAIRDVLRFSVYLLGFNAVNFFARNFDNLLIGKYLGFYPLGIYGKAYQLMMFPLAQISWGVARVMFPSMSAIQHDRGKVKNVYLKCLRAIALITFPLMAGLFVVSGPFVSAFFGEKWAPMVPVIRIFCLAGLLDSVTTTVGLIYQSQGRTDVQFKMILVQIVIILSAFVIGLSWGITGVAAGYLVAALIFLYPEWKIAGRLIDLTFGEMARNLSGTFLCAAGMAAAVWVFGMMLPYGWASWMRLAAEVFFGVGAYAALVRIFRLKGYREAGEIVSSLYRKAS
jgi:PST family polysaccharide transporter